MEVRDPEGKLVSIVDSRHVIRERPKPEAGSAASEARSQAKPGGGGRE